MNSSKAVSVILFTEGTLSFRSVKTSISPCLFLVGILQKSFITVLGLVLVLFVFCVLIEFTVCEFFV